MKPSDLFLILIAPFFPKRAFKRLQLNENKKLISLTTIILTFITTTTFHHFFTEKTALNISAVYSLGLLTNILITGIVVAIISSKTITVKLDLLEGISISAISALVFISSPILQLALNISSTISETIQSILFSLLICKGLSVYYNLPMRKTISIGILIVVFKGIISLSFFGIQI
tara:strand:+ start:88 stop:609 length:522 start_codon:yes stop_codon:yes gene_type:complete